MSESDTGPTAERLPTYAQPALGFRVWVARGRLLRSTGHGKTVWRPGENLAYCGTMKHHAPDPDCHCGWNAWNSFDHATQLAGQLTRGDDPIVGGIVLGAGRVEVHSQGFRAERAQIIALVEIPPAVGQRVLDPWQADKLREEYEIPLFASIDDAAEMIAQFSPPPEATRPSKEEVAASRQQRERRAKSKQPTPQPTPEQPFQVTQKPTFCARVFGGEVISMVWALVCVVGMLAGFPLFAEKLVSDPAAIVVICAGGMWMAMCAISVLQVWSEWTRRAGLYSVGRCERIRRDPDQVKAARAYYAKLSARERASKFRARYRLVYRWMGSEGARAKWAARRWRRALERGREFKLSRRQVTGLEQWADERIGEALSRARNPRSYQLAMWIDAAPTYLLVSVVPLVALVFGFSLTDWLVVVGAWIVPAIVGLFFSPTLWRVIICEHSG